MIIQNPRLGIAVLALSAVITTGCASPAPRTALPQTSKVGDPPIVFAGSYDLSLIHI